MGDNELIEFYKECYNNKFTEFDDEYQNYKIQVIAKKHGLNEVDKQTFINARKLYSHKLDEEINKRTGELEKLLKAETLRVHKEISDSYTPLYSLGPKEKRVYELKEQIKKLQEAVDTVEKLKGVLVDSYYSGSKQSHESWFLQGLGAELATGSRVVGSLAVANVNEKNRQIDAENAQLKAKIQNQIYNDSQYDTSKQRAELRILRSKLNECELAFTSDNKNYFKYVGYSDLRWDTTDFDDSIVIRAKVWLKEKPKMPNGIDASIDGIAQAVLYNKENLTELANVLVPLPVLGVCSPEPKDVMGINLKDKHKLDDIDADKIGVALIGYTVGAIEEKSVTAKMGNSAGDGLIQDKLYYDYIINNCNENEVVSVKNAISQIDSIDSNIDGKDEYLGELKELLPMLIAKKEEADRLAEEKRVADEKAAAALAEENKKKKKKRLIIFGPIALVVIIIIAVYALVITPKQNYQGGLELLRQGQFDAAYQKLNGNRTEDSAVYAGILSDINAKKYTNALESIKNNNIDEEIKYILSDYAYAQIVGDIGNGLTDVEGYASIPDSFFQNNKERCYSKAVDLVTNKQYDNALLLFKKMSGYSDTNKYMHYCSGMIAKDPKKAFSEFVSCKGFLDTNTQINTTVTAIMNSAEKIPIASAIEYFKECSSLDSGLRKIYELCLDLTQYEGAYEAYKSTEGLGDNKSKAITNPFKPFSLYFFVDHYTDRNKNNIVTVYWYWDERLEGEIYTTEHVNFSEKDLPTGYRYCKSPNAATYTWMLFGKDNEAFYCNGSWGPNSRGVYSTWYKKR